jgi:hypothetical protein
MAATAVAVAVVLGVTLLPATTPGVDANLTNIARATRTLTAEELPVGAYVYSRFESTVRIFDATPEGRAFSYLLPETVDVWVRGQYTEERRLAGPPTFTDPTAEAYYYASGRDVAEGIGKTRTVIVEQTLGDVDVSALSTDVEALREQIIAGLPQNAEAMPDREVRIVDKVTELMDPRHMAPPELRAALLEILAELDVTSQLGADGSVFVEVMYSDTTGTQFLQELEFDAGGYLRVDRFTLLSAPEGVDAPEGLVSEFKYSRPTIVDGSGVLPG